MENMHLIPETSLKRKNKYNMELLIELNEEYRKSHICQTLLNVIMNYKLRVT